METKIKPFSSLIVFFIYFLTQCTPGATDNKEQIKNRIQETYSFISNVYNTNTPIEHIQRGKKEADSLFCSKEWNKLLKSVEKTEQQKEGELGFWEADYWIMAQDFDSVYIDNITIESATNETEAIATFTLHNLGNQQPVKVAMTNDNGLWFINDFYLETGDSLKEMMKQYVKDNKQ